MNRGKSAPITASVVLLGTLLALAVFLRPTTPVHAEPNRDEAVQVGRFQISGAGTTAYVIDTATGRVWNSMEDGESFRKPKPLR